MKIVKIYYLCDPRCPNIIRYIGKTSQSLNRRLNAHICDAKNKRYKHHNCNWIQSLLKDNVLPIIEEIDSIICYTNKKEEWDWLEKYWIAQMKCWGFKLTNSTDGGDGNQNQIFPEDHYKKISQKLKGRPRPQNVRMKISQSNKGKAKSKEHINHVKESIIKKQGKPVLQYTLDGNFIQEWRCIKEAADFYNVDASSLMRCCQGKFKKSVGYVWKYKSEDIV